MYCYLRKNLRYEKKVHIKKELLLSPNFEEEINKIDKGITSSKNLDETDDNIVPSKTFESAQKAEKIAED
jgi:hypothetical protein